MLKASTIKNYSTKGIYISKDLSDEDKIKEKACLRRRYELIQSGVDKKDLRIKMCKLYNKNNEVDCSTL